MPQLEWLADKCPVQLSVPFVSIFLGSVNLFHEQVHSGHVLIGMIEFASVRHLFVQPNTLRVFPED
jgi:hypothetical protein